MSKYLDLNGLSTLWGKIKDKFVTKTDFNSAMSQKQNSLGISTTGSANKFLNQQGSFVSVETDLSAYAKKTDIPTTLPASDVKAWAKAASKPTYTKAEIGLGNVDNTADADKSVKYATTAGTANSVTWQNVNGKPSSMPASDVAAWAKADTKPAYTKSEVGLGNVDNTADSAKDVKHAKSADSVAWSGVTGKPTTLGGYGITDAFGDNKLLASWANPWEGYDHYEGASKGYLTGEKGGDLITPVIQDYTGQYTLSFACWGAHGNAREAVAHIKVTVYEYTVSPSLYGSSSNLSEFAISKGTVVKETTIGDLQAVDNIDGDLRYLLDLVESSGSVKAWRVRFSDTETIAIGKAMVEIGTGKHSLYPDGPENVMEAVRDIYPFIPVLGKIYSTSDVTLLSKDGFGVVSLDLNSGAWIKSSTKIGTHDIYQSDKGSYNVENGVSKCRLTFSNLPNLRIMVRSNGESDYDYVEIGKMDQVASRGKNVSVSFKSKLSDSTYTEVPLKNDGGDHFVEILYSKDGSNNNNEDRGFFYFPDDFNVVSFTYTAVAEATAAANKAAKASSDANVAVADMNRYMEVVKKPIVTTSDASVAMDSNKMYVITISSSVTITLNAASDTTITNDWEGAFDTGSSVPTVVWPSGVKWGDSDMTLKANTHYEFSIRQAGASSPYYGILHAWS